MGSRTGFGHQSDLLVHSDNANSVVILPSRNKSQRIFNIQCAYTLFVGGANTKLTQGRVIIALGVKFDGSAIKLDIDPYSTTKPALLAASTILFDSPIVRKESAPISLVETFSWINGLEIPPNNDCSIILAQANGDGAAYPNSSNVYAFLNVSGLSDGNDKIFKNV